MKKSTRKTYKPVTWAVDAFISHDGRPILCLFKTEDKPATFYYPTAESYKRIAWLIYNDPAWRVEPRITSPGFAASRPH